MKLPRPVIPPVLTPVPDIETLVRRTMLSCEGEGDLRNVSIERLTLTDGSLCGMVLRGARVSGCRLPACDLSSADWTDVVFTDCDLSGCNLSRASLRRCSFDGCKGVGLQFTDGAVLEAEFTGCNFDYCNLASTTLRKTMLTRGPMLTARVYECKLIMLTLDGTDLTRATVFHTPLDGLDLTHAVLDGLTANPESLFGALVTRDQAAGLAPLFGLRVSP